MAYGRSSSLFRILTRNSNKKPETISGKNVSTQKADGSISLLGSGSAKEIAAAETDTANEVLPFEAIPGPKPSIPFIGTGWQYFPGGKIHFIIFDYSIEY